MRITEWQQGGFLYLLLRCFLPFSCDRKKNPGNSHLKSWFGEKRINIILPWKLSCRKKVVPLLINEVAEFICNEARKCSEEDKQCSFSSLCFLRSAGSVYRAQAQSHRSWQRSAEGIGRSQNCTPPLPPSSHINQEHHTLFQFQNHSLTLRYAKP